MSDADARLLDGRYRVGPRIARGGMASVYEAHDVRLDRTVAVKIMHPGLADSDSDVAERFVLEARAAARLSHPNVVAVYDQGDDDGTVYLAMELVTGHTLRDTVAREAPLPPSRALALTEPVLSALAAAHRAGLIHRDVKPENVLIATDPESGASRVKVADFGLAKAVGTETGHTATQGLLIGTVSYLAPELVVDGRADARADVYAAGVMLYELLTGRKPHEGESPIAVAYRHVHHDVPPPSALEPGIPEYVDALVARATSRDRDQRPADAGVLLHQVRRVAQALRTGVRDDPELTQDLAPQLAAAAWADAGRCHDRAGGDEDHEPTTTLQVVGAPPPGPPPSTPPPTPPRAASASSAPGRSRRSRRGPALLVLALVLALAVGGGAFWYGWARYVPAPSLIGSDRAEAVAAVEDAGLEVDFADPVYDPDVAEGSVVATDPRGGAQVLPGDTVTLTLSLGRLLVPQVRGGSEDQAQDTLLAAQLEVGESVGRYSESQAEDVVLGTDPKAGTELAPGDTVRIVVSLGRRPVQVGSWVGEDADAAVEALERRGLVPQVTEAFDDQVPEGAVVSQDPDGGTAFRGDAISLVVSQGPELVEVPRVVRFGIEAAEQAMREAGLVTEQQEADLYLGLGFVASTDPPPGTMVPRGSTVTLFIV